MGVFTLHASNIKGIAFEFASARPVYVDWASGCKLPSIRFDFNLIGRAVCRCYPRVLWWIHQIILRFRILYVRLFCRLCSLRYPRVLWW